MGGWFYARFRALKSRSNRIIKSDAEPISLPDTVRERYRLTPDVPIRLIETRSGILLIPLTDEPMSEALAQELAEWQSLSMNSWEMFPYADNEDGDA